MAVQEVWFQLVGGGFDVVVFGGVVVFFQMEFVWCQVQFVMEDDDFGWIDFEEICCFVD